MTARTQNAFPLFELTIIAALALIGWVAFRLYEIVPEVNANRKQLADLRTEYFQVAEFVQSRISTLDEALTNALQTHEAAQMARFRSKSQEWQKWLEKEKSHWNLGASPGPRPEAVPTGPSSLATNQSPQVQNQLATLLQGI